MIPPYPKLEPYELHPKQEEVMLSGKRFVAFIGGVHSGKTSLAPKWLALQIARNPKGRFLCVSPTYILMERAMLPELCGQYRGTALEMTNYNGQKRMGTLRCGATIYFGTADRPESLESVHVHAVWLDEAGQFKRLSWIAILGRLSFFKAPCLLTTTPYNMGWLWQEFVLPWQKGLRADTDVVISESRENPAFDEMEFKAAQLRMTAREFNMKYRAQFERPEGLYFPDWSDENIVDAVIGNPVECHGGVDWGFGNPASLGIAIKTDAGHYYRVSESYKTHQEVEALVAAAQKMEAEVQAEFGIRPEMWECGHDEPEHIKKFNAAGLNAHKSRATKPGKKGPSVSNMQSLVKMNRFHVLRNRCPDFTDEMETTKLDGERIKGPDHALDDNRMALFGFKGAGEVYDGSSYGTAGDMQAVEDKKTTADDAGVRAMIDELAAAGGERVTAICQAFVRNPTPAVLAALKANQDSDNAQVSMRCREILRVLKATGRA